MRRDLPNALRSAGLGLLTLGLLGLASQVYSEPDCSPGAGLDPAQVVGPEACADCHDFEWQTLQRTSHHEGFRDLHRDPKARAIAKALGGAEVLERKDCADCHLTRQATEAGRVEVTAGVSCESCHGAAKGWLDLHWDGESDEDLALNLEKSAKLGMLRPRDITGIATRCLKCHAITDSQLIAAGHPRGEGFELLSWLQGEVRHNFLRAKTNGENVPASSKRRRALAVAGRLITLEVLLRRFARLADREAEPARALAARILDAYREVKALREDEPRLEAVKAALAEVELASSPAADIAAAADAIRALSQTLTEDGGASLPATIDARLPTETRGEARDYRSSK